MKNLSTIRLTVIGKYDALPLDFPTSQCFCSQSAGNSPCQRPKSALRWALPMLWRPPGSCIGIIASAAGKKNHPPDMQPFKIIILRGNMYNIYIYTHIYIVISIIIFRSTNQETVLKDASVAHADLSIEISFHSCSILIPPRLKTFLEPVECIVSNHGDPIMGQNHGILIPN